MRIQKINDLKTKYDPWLFSSKYITDTHAGWQCIFYVKRMGMGLFYYCLLHTRKTIALDKIYNTDSNTNLIILCVCVCLSMCSAQEWYEMRLKKKMSIILYSCRWCVLWSMIHLSLCVRCSYGVPSLPVSPFLIHLPFSCWVCHLPIKRAGNIWKPKGFTRFKYIKYN